MPTPAVAPVTPEPVAPTTPMPQVATMPSVEQVAPIAPEQVTPVTPQAPAMPTVEPVMQAEVTPEMPTVQPIAPTPQAPVEQPAIQPQTSTGPVIYGGANPIVPEININEPQHQIYGGANPLENTQSIPISNLTGQQNLVQTPTQEPAMVTPQVTPVAGEPNNMGQ